MINQIFNFLRFVAKDQIHCFSRGEVRKFFCKDDAMHFLRYRKVYDYENS